MSRAIENIEDKIRKYAECHAVASKNGDYREANRNYDKLAMLLSKLRATHDKGEGILLRLMKDRSDAVSMWAATQSLPIAEKEALATLEAVVARGGIIGLDAEMVIKEWKSGRLTIR